MEVDGGRFHEARFPTPCACPSTFPAMPAVPAVGGGRVGRVGDIAMPAKWSKWHAMPADLAWVIKFNMAFSVSYLHTCLPTPTLLLPSIPFPSPCEHPVSNCLGV